MEDEPEMLTVSEAAKEKGVHLKSVYRAISEKRLPSQKRYGVTLIRREDLAAWQPWQPGPRKKKIEESGEA